ncbi:PIG-L family deacetylase [Frankia sp. CNm7]|uniref:PIG-L family deacetylase n=1 Tax=Frankia nepalensis TaxID=1836974 RepID=A0A937RER4_9ACTN|nr:PIG-L family deacetylase [Frankia nepalensis]MBL7498392.1 PIG-L family deacetylase [Frankia nepalensis]MBL7516020.1 PIG-L family deacetylase [Frankia nepalensis]MBL7521515.1 PIG-L family deacetylase [Frankia nepalensis]MBL7628882.1 PIG-L family deacetylase [Frankia nepalensis]
MNRSRIADLGTVLTIWAHPDDETYLAGGLMAAAVAAGQRVVCVSATAGELGTDDPVAWPPERLAAVRRLEAAAALAVLGVQEHRFLGLPDGGLDLWDDVGARLVSELIDEIRPDTVVTFGPDGFTFHPDHLAVHRWVRAAWEARGRGFRLLETAWTAESLERFGALSARIGVFMTDERPVGVPAAALSEHLPLAGPALDRKVTALRAMASQVEPTVGAFGLDLFTAWVAEEGFVDAARTARTRGTARTGRTARAARAGRAGRAGRAARAVGVPVDAEFGSIPAQRSEMVAA